MNAVDVELRRYIQTSVELLDELPAEEHEAIIGALLHEVAQQPLNVVEDKRCSLALEKVLARASARDLTRFADALSGKAVRVACNVNACHVLECLFAQLQRFADAAKAPETAATAASSAVSKKRKTRDGEEEEEEEADDDDDDDDDDEQAAAVSTLYTRVVALFTEIRHCEAAAAALGARDVDAPAMPHAGAALVRDFADVVAHQYGSHAVATALGALHAVRGASRAAADAYNDALQYVVTRPAGWFAAFAVDAYASHVVRALLRTESKASTASLSEASPATPAPTAQWRALVDAVLLRALSDGERARVQREHVASLMRHAVGSQVLQCVLETCDAAFFDMFEASALRGRRALLELAEHPLANYVVQSALAAAPDAARLTRLLAPLLPQTAALLGLRAINYDDDNDDNNQQPATASFDARDFGRVKNRAGVVLHMALAAARVGSDATQRDVFDAVVRALAPPAESAAEARAQLLSRLLRLHQPPSTRAAYSGVGCRVAAALAAFARHTAAPRALADALRDGGAAARDAPRMATDAAASHVLDALLAAAAVDASALARRFAGRFASLAAHRYGSHTVDAAFARGDDGVRVMIARELAAPAAAARLGDAACGRAVLRNCHVDAFRRARSPDAWLAGLRSESKRRERSTRFLDDVLGAPGATTTKTAARTDDSTTTTTTSMKEDNLTDEVLSILSGQ